ncbi:hypothetical protein [Streptomyces sp. NBC_00124]|uniref:hypothetical protein n=1 Tax=Streptomyces sp. NBC_00124 TaxID=2975662 RepID=UPI00224D38CC|nr:hypothetical protein [Streptomyces sp. NBC_00124]
MPDHDRPRVGGRPPGTYLPAVGIEGRVFRPLAGRYVPGGRGWTKYKARHTVEAIVGAVTGSLRAPTALLGRYDESGRLRYTGWTITLGVAVRHALADQLHAGDTGHPWTGRTFRVGWGSREQLSVHLVVPEVVAEVAVDVARDSQTLAPGPAHAYPHRHGAGRGAVVRGGWLVL